MVPNQAFLREYEEPSESIFNMGEIYWADQFQATIKMIANYSRINFDDGIIIRYVVLNLKILCWKHWMITIMTRKPRPLSGSGIRMWIYT